MRARILVVDDEQCICDVLECLFQQAGHETTVVNRADQVFGVLERQEFDLVILDVALDDADGLELLPEIRRIQPGLPVIVLSGFGFERDLMVDVLRKHSARYVDKTQAPGELLVEVRQALQGVW